MNGNILVDGRNIYEDRELKTEGFEYIRIGV